MIGLTSVILLLSVAHSAMSSCNKICTLEFAPVCGSDGKTYSNKCFFEAAKCNSGNSDLTIVHFGQCESRQKRQSNPFDCPERSSKGFCTYEYNPVCGNDGKTYGNPCDFCFNQYTKSQNGEELMFESFGECKPKVECPDQFKTGVCTMEYSPICGTDGKTYGNRCTFCYAKLSMNEDLEAEKLGECDAQIEKRSVEDFECPARYSTGFCTREYFPICATNGKTYGNKCTFCFSKSQMNGDLTVDHYGSCADKKKRSVEDVECLDRYKSGVCTKELFPICGTDGKTYGNKCMYCFAKYNKNENLAVNHFGRCQEQPEDLVQCREQDKNGVCTREYFPICGSDGKTYGNKCTFCYAKYNKGSNGEQLVAKAIGQCPSAKTITECPPASEVKVCTAIYAPVCGNDGKTYASHCMLCGEMYRRQQAGEDVHIHVVHEGEC